MIPSRLCTLDIINCAPVLLYRKLLLIGAMILEDHMILFVIGSDVLAAQAIFTSNQGKVVQLVRDKAVDFGFVRTDQIEGMEAKGLVDKDTFKFIGTRTLQTASGDNFPFGLSTSLYPEW